MTTLAAGAAGTVCVVCGASASPLVHAEAPLCGGPACAWTLRTTPVDRACGICHRPLTAAQVAEGVCGATECRVAWVRGRRQARENARREAREAREAREWAAFEAVALVERELAARQLRIAQPESYPLVRVPHYDGHSAPLSARRRRLFREHLLRMLASATERPVPAAYDRPAWDAEPPPTPELSAVLGRGCAVCRGNCCSRGGERAYISEETMRRYRAEHPGVSDEAIVDAYMSHLVARTYAGSCVYHAPGGCTLPRDMRAGICNRFLCDGLRTFRDRHAADTPLRAFYVGVAPTLDESRTAFVDVRELRVVRRRRPVEPGPDAVT